MRITLIIITLFLSLGLYAQDPIEGLWKTVYEENNEPSSFIRLQVKNGELTGTIVKLFDFDDDFLCARCPGEKKDQPIVGMDLVYGLTQEDDMWTGGLLINPQNGKTYRCRLYLEDDDTINLRGYFFIPAIGKTIKWYRVEE